MRMGNFLVMGAVPIWPDIRLTVRPMAAVVMAVIVMAVMVMAVVVMAVMLVAVELRYCPTVTEAHGCPLVL